MDVFAWALRAKNAFVIFASSRLCGESRAAADPSQGERALAEDLPQLPLNGE